MSDTTNCTNCGAPMPAAAAFCTNCGSRIEAAAPPVVEDATRVDNPGLHDATQVYTPPAAPAEPSYAPPPPAPPAETPWQPAAPPPPAAPAAPAWQAAPAPPAPPTAPTWGAAPPGPPTAPTSPTGQPAWVPPGGVAAPAVGATTEKKGSPLAAIAALLGGLLILAGTFTAWVVNKATDGALSGWDLTSGDKGFVLPTGNLLTFKSSDPYLVLGLGVAALVIGVALFTGSVNKPAKIAALVVGIAVVVVMVMDWSSITDLVTKNAPGDFEVKTGVGFILAAAGGVVTALAAILPGKKA